MWLEWRTVYRASQLSESLICFWLICQTFSRKKMCKHSLHVQGSHLWTMDFFFQRKQFQFISSLIWGTLCKNLPHFQIYFPKKLVLSHGQTPISPAVMLKIYVVHSFWTGRRQMTVVVCFKITATPVAELHTVCIK